MIITIIFLKGSLILNLKVDAFNLQLYTRSYLNSSLIILMDPSNFIVHIIYLNLYKAKYNLFTKIAESQILQYYYFVIFKKY